MQVGKLSRLVGVGLKIESQQKQNKTLKAKISFSSIRRKIAGLHLTWTGSEPWVFFFKSRSDPRDFFRQCKIILIGCLVPLNHTMINILEARTRFGDTLKVKHRLCKKKIII